jgi:dolichol kinase
MVISFLVVLFCYWQPEAAGLTPVVGGAIVVGAVITLVEAISPHGWDNFTIPVSAALVLHGTFA